MGKYLLTYILFLFTLTWFTNCSPSSDITVSEAKNLIQEYIENNPTYETGNFYTSKMKINLTKEKNLTNDLKKLVKEGYVDIIHEKKRKKFLSKDSIWIIEPILTKKALPYVVKQKSNKTEVITVEYKLNKDQDILFNNKGKKSVTCTAILDKVRTPFYAFGSDKNNKSDFITKKFKLKYNEQEGWYINP